MAEAVARQKCPNCGQSHDVSVYVSGQRLRCRCGLHFEVQRQDVRPTPRPAAPPGTPRPVPREPSIPEVVPSASAVAPSPDKLGPPVAAEPEEKDDEAFAPTMVGRALQLPGYELMELLGRGGMGEVWKARQVSLGRTVAIKALSPELARDADFVRRFEKEAAALAALSHPGLVQIIERGFCEASGTWFIAMEFCEGRSLRDRMENGPLPVHDAISVVVQVCRAIDSAHQKGVIHRDLKPENILVDANGQAKIVDFGLAGLQGGDGRLNLTQAAMAMGTLHYMAPEQRSDARSVDARADVFALGVILYELLVGEVPLGRFKTPSERRPGLDPRIDPIVLRALEPEPDARYQSAEAMVQELAPLLATAVLPAEALASVPTPRAATPAPRRRAAARVEQTPRRLPLYVGAGVLGLALLLGLGRLGDGGEKRSGTTSLGLEVTRTTAGGIATAQVGFRQGRELLKAGGGEWRLEGDGLVAKAGSQALSLATLETAPMRAEGVVLEVVASVEAASSAGVPQVELALLGEGGSRIGFGASFGADGRFRLCFRAPGGQEEIFEAPAGQALEPGRPLRLKLVALWGEIEASAGTGEQLSVLFKKRLPLSGVSGKPALGCGGATCRFSSWRMAERVGGANAEK